MRLKQLTLIDFGVYQGKVVFDLSSDDKPIVIFGGKNGSGKTTLLESIKLCLYGPRALGQKVGRKEYEEHIRNRIHRRRGAIVPLNHTSISLSFDYSNFGKEQNYEVIRSWKVKSENFQEQLIINLNGKLLTNVPEEHLQGYIDDLMPPSITDLFFFDGEKIQELVIDNFNEQALAGEVKKLLGLNVIEKLQADLDTYLYRQRKENSIIDLQTKLDNFETAFRSIDKQYQKKLQELSHHQTKAEYIKGQIEKLERKINLESSGYAFQRGALQNQLSKIDIELDVAKKQLHELSAGLLPFALVPELCQELKLRLLAEGELQKWQASNLLLTPKITQIRQTINSNEFWVKVDGNLPLKNRQEIVIQISALLDELLGPDDHNGETVILHNVSDFERYQMITWIDESIRSIPGKILDIGDRQLKLERTRQEINIKLRNVPEDEVLRPLIENLNLLNQELAKIENVIKHADQDKETLNNEREAAERQIKKAFENFKLGKRVEDRLKMVEKTQKILIDFLNEVTNRKIIQLENLVVDKFRNICRKPDLVKRVVIDPKSFHIQLFDFEGFPVPKNLLSAGEKQIFAIALLWALRDLSGKPFPIIIDTPLGRLDSDHRDHLVNEYFTRVSHQVILFSTDTEIDQEYFKALEHEISHTYYLDYDPTKGKTNPTLSFFWKEGKYAAEQNQSI